jgi:predicted transposase/invertase (TIGR01784 family)
MMIFSKFLDPKNDFAFKQILGTDKNKAILIHFLNDMLKAFVRHKIETVSFLKTVQDPEIASKKQSIVDVLCVDEIGDQYIVEMQVARNTHFVKRAQYYAAKAYSSQIYKGEDYSKLKEIIFIAITDFVMFPDKSEFKSDHVILDKSSHAHDLKDFSFCFLELPKFNKTVEQLETMTDKWAYFFKHAHTTSEANLLQIVGNDSIIQDAYEALNQYSWSPEELLTYEQELKRERDAQSILLASVEQGREQGLALGLEQGLQQGLEQGREQGLEQGREQALKQVASRLLSQGHKLEEVSEITGFSTAELISLSARLEIPPTAVREHLEQN